MIGNKAVVTGLGLSNDGTLNIGFNAVALHTVPLCWSQAATRMPGTRLKVIFARHGRL